MRWGMKIALLTMVLSFGLSACGQTPNGPAGDENSGKVSTTEQVSNSPVGAWLQFPSGDDLEKSYWIPWLY